MQAPSALRCSGRCSMTALSDRQSPVLRHAHRPDSFARGSHRAHSVTVLASSGSSQTEQSPDREAQQCWRHRVAGGMAAAALSACIAVSPAAAAEPFLTATGAYRRCLLLCFRHATVCMWNITVWLCSAAIEGAVAWHAQEHKACSETRRRSCFVFERRRRARCTIEQRAISSIFSPAASLAVIMMRRLAL